MTHTKHWRLVIYVSSSKISVEKCMYVCLEFKRGTRKHISMYDSTLSEVQSCIFPGMYLEKLMSGHLN